MGNICGKQDSQPDPPGRLVGSPPVPQKTSAVPKKVGGPPRTLGSSARPGAGAGAATSASSSGGQDDARKRAAEAAEARAQAAGKGGKLQSQLSAQKRQSRSDALKQASAQEQRVREADDATRARNWD
ncbi:hypothetical protein HIM_07090 [Hirsutella minnesotensis 3608]|uniref:Uncharacterized protein n=1 Tax=Hirsutella minnesotensis 3608 TaxID=1043627 RepID=A0A0F8A4G4_9HYPO|nr:hypothetical protein HIM_07090 [Hirsutella minnesotensis 3608]